MTSRTHQIFLRDGFPKWDYFENNNLQPCTTIQQFRFKTRVPWPNISFIFRELELLHQQFIYADVKQLTKQSGCLKPCKHKKYRVIGDPQVEFGDKSLQTDMILSETFIPRDLQILVRVRNLPYSPFLMTQRFILKQDNERKFTKHQVETEELIYPWQSFLAEFGGALGLFLGFSFMTVWDSLVELPVIMGIHYVGSRK